MRILAFDLSSHTGWAYMDGPSLIKSGSFDVEIKDWKSDVSKSDQFSLSFPFNFDESIQQIVEKCKELTLQFRPELVVTEFIEGSSHRFSQLFLDWIHRDFFSAMRSLDQKYSYILNSDWRNSVKCWISQHPELEKYNSKIGRLKRKSKSAGEGKSAKLGGKIVTRLDQKDISIMLAVQRFPHLKGLKSDDEADAINQCYAAQVIWGGLEPVSFSALSPNMTVYYRIPNDLEFLVTEDLETAKKFGEPTKVQLLTTSIHSISGREIKPKELLKYKKKYAALEFDCPLDGTTLKVVTVSDPKLVKGLPEV